MTTHRVVIPMLSPAAFPVTLKRSPVPTYYHGDMVRGVDQADLQRLVAAGWVEAVDEPQELVAQ